MMADVEELYGIAAEWGRRDYWDMVAATRSPMLVIEAGNSPMPGGQQREMATRAGASYVKIEGADHIVHETAPEEFRGAVEAFLADL
jgi:pimeloyl-ACP methyl ester carboxylesterase